MNFPSGQIKENHFTQPGQLFDSGGFSVLTGGDQNPVICHVNVERKQRTARARSSGALASLWIEKRAMGSASQKAAIVVEEFVRPPVERCSGVVAVIDVGVV